MSEASLGDTTPTEHNQMHELYRQGGKQHQTAPHVVYADANCPHSGCDQRMQAIDFRLEDHGKHIHDPLVTAWWDDTGFAGKCPTCNGWIHFTIQSKTAIEETDARQLPLLPEDWFAKATVL